MRRTHVAACAAIAAVLGTAPSALAKPKDINSTRLENAVTVEGIHQHQKALQNIADLNGGTRYTRTPGFTASAAYVLETLKKAGYSNAHYEQFNMPEWEETAPPLLQQTAPNAKTYKSGTAADDGSPNVDYITFEHSPTASVTNAKVIGVGHTQVPSPGGSTSGCVAADYPAEVAGNVALIQRGTCAFTEKLALAEEAGAKGVILFNEGDPGRTAALFRSANPGYSIPAVLSSYAVGEELYNAWKNGQNPTVNLSTSGKDVDKFYPNVVAETKGGDPNHVVLAGAHLDSVPAGPGVNDDGSGTSFQLEMAEQLAKAGTPPRNKIRFLWFGGEEDGLVGSQYYAAHMSDADVARSDMMLDTDMISSPNFARLVYDGDGSTFGSDVSGPAGSGKVEEVLTKYWTQRGMVSEPIPFDGRSDYVGFVNRGIPSGGVFAGAEAPKTAQQVAWYGGVQGEQLDPCYHEACDSYDTVTGQPPAETMNVYENDPTPANLAIAQQQADSLNGNATRSLQQFKGNLVHAIWYFARSKNAFGSSSATATKATASKAGKKAQKRTARFKYQGHKRANKR